MVEVQRRHHPFNKGSNFTHSLRLSTPTWLRVLEQLHGNSATESWHRCHSTETRLAKEVQLGRHQWMAMYRTRTIRIPINTSKKKRVSETEMLGQSFGCNCDQLLCQGQVEFTPLSNDAFIGSARFKAQTNKPCSLYYLNIFIPSQAHFATYVPHVFLFSLSMKTAETTETLCFTGMLYVSLSTKNAFCHLSAYPTGSFT